MFNFLKKNKVNKTTDENRSNQNVENNMANPSYLFSQCGPTLNEFWQDIVKGENKAVQEYNSFCNYNSQTLSKDLINRFKETELSKTCDTEKKISLSRGQLAYLSCFNFDNDLYIANDDESEVLILTREELTKAVNTLSEHEKEYRDKIKKYFQQNIVPKVNAVANARWDIDICKHSLPLNTKRCVQYHRYIAGENYDFNGGENSKWNFISQAPMYEYRTDEVNPIIPISIDMLNAFVLDCLCYSNIALPTLDLLKLLHYRDENGSVKDSLETRFGPGVVNFMMKCIADYSCANFRKWVCMGLQTK